MTIRHFEGGRRTEVYGNVHENSVCDSKFDPKKGKQKSAIAIPGGL